MVLSTPQLSATPWSLFSYWAPPFGGEALVLHEHATLGVQDMYYGRLMVQRQPITRLHTCTSSRVYLRCLRHRSGSCCCARDPYAWFHLFSKQHVSVKCSTLPAAYDVLELTLTLHWLGKISGHTQQNAQCSQQNTPLRYYCNATTHHRSICYYGRLLPLQEFCVTARTTVCQRSVLATCTPHGGLRSLSCANNNCSHTHMASDIKAATFN